MTDPFKDKESSVKKANDILDDLVEYTGKPRDLVIQRSKAAMAELAWQWHFRKDTLSYYRETDLYIFDLTKYQSQIVMDLNLMIEELKVRKLKKVLDLGGGIGEYTIRAIKEAGCEVTFLDLKDSKTMEYAKWRFTKHGVRPTIVTEEYAWQQEDWDAVFAMDVIEHLEKKDAEETIEALKKHTMYVFANPEFIKFNDLFPQHITQFTLQGFKSVGTQLWQNTLI